MLFPEKVVEALQDKRQLFQAAQASLQSAYTELASALTQFEGCSQQDLEVMLKDIAWPGARPTIEQDLQPSVISFGQSWVHHQEARAWAMDILRGVSTFAADGSQISPQKDISIPVGMVQIGWFENDHVDDGQGLYIKDVAVEILAPDELSGNESNFADQEVEWRRFRGEASQAIRFMQAHASDPTHALAFVDGSLIVSFVGQFSPERQVDYITTMEELLHVSEVTRVPLIGYVDTSYANDLVSMVEYLSNLSQRVRISDPALFSPSLTGWGDRTRLYACARDDRVLPVNGNKYYLQVHFTYLRTNTGSPPSRVELPAWVLADGRQDAVLDIIRAECVVGTGYPYSLETADATAVLTAEDRERFLALFQQFAVREGLPLHFSRKAISKRQRRI